jgi:NhaP-type Na+/H+ or K+/H+ antiporter
MAGLALILALGMVSQVIGWYTRIPSIVILIVAGLIAGPITGWLHPEEIFGDLLQPFISLSVAVILFEGGLSLKFNEIKSTAPVVVRLITVGVLLTWAVGSAAAVWILGLDWPLAVLLASILVISGPTVIMPLLRHLRLRGDLGPILKWEGILIDPIGATLALIVFGVILAAGPEEAITQGLTTLAVSLITGLGLGLLTGLAMIQLLRRYLLPDYLQIPVVLSTVIGVFFLSDLIQADAGLFTVVIMGVVMANQRRVNVEHILDFKETLGLILISILFITLSATIDIDAIVPLAGGILGFSLILILVARPLAVLVASRGSRLKSRERVLLGVIAPRGIVSASVASLFGFRLAENGFAGADILLPVTFAVIILTVISSSVLSTLAARLFGMSNTNPQGVVFVGGQIWVREIATALEEAGVRTFIIDHSRSNIAYARRKKLPAYYGNALAPGITGELDLADFGRVLAMTSDDNVNHLVAAHYGREFGTANVYLLPPEETATDTKKEHIQQHLPGRLLFSASFSYEKLADLHANGARVKTFELTSDFPFKAFTSDNPKAVPLFLITAGGEVTVITPETEPADRADLTLLALVP